MVLKYHTASIEEFKHAAKEIEDRFITLGPYLSSRGKLVNLCLRLESDSVVYERRLDRKFLPRLTELKGKVYYLEMVVKLLEKDLVGQGFSVKTERITELPKYPRLMGDEDYAYLFKLMNNQG
jgi:hypothetical protein